MYFRVTVLFLACQSDGMVTCGVQVSLIWTENTPTYL